MTEIIFDRENRYVRELEAIFDRNNQSYVWDRKALSGEMEKAVWLKDGVPGGYAILYEGGDFCRKEGFPAELTAPEDAVYIWQLVVDREMTGQGIGGKLLREIKRNYPGRELYLCVDEENKAACRCYAREGFQTVLEFWKESHGKNSRYSIRKAAGEDPAADEWKNR